MNIRTCLCSWIFILGMAVQGFALDRPGETFKIFQFPKDQIPRIDGDASDWAIVPDSYAIGMDQLTDEYNAPASEANKPDLNRLNATVKIGWVKGESRLYFLYEATKAYWDFGKPLLHNDIFELVVDGDRSGGPLIGEQHDEAATRPSNELYYDFQNYQAQNYHIFTPALNKEWCMVWGPQAWLRDMPYANIAYKYNFKPTESGKLTMEFWITPFDYAPAEGPERAVASKLEENKIIAMSYALLDYGDENARDYKYFWTLSKHKKMFGNASELVAFKLMPLEPRFLKAIDSHWSYKLVDLDRRVVAFKDESVGKIASWDWDFSDGSPHSTEQNPIHTYTRAGRFSVNLTVTGPGGKSQLQKVWGVALK